MTSTLGDFKLAAVAAGFTLGFGFLTVWKAIRQTISIKAPHRSAYIYMVWGEIAANLGIGIVGWLFLEGRVPPVIPVLFSLLTFWVFEIQLLMQIIINRIFVVAEKKDTVTKVKWLTAAIITAINIAVFCIWIPAHMDPPPSPTYVAINEYWDRTSKVLVLIVDAALNVWFLRIVKQRLVRYHGLKKYEPLVQFNARLMVVSIAMDILLIGLMSLRNQLVYMMFHPVTYMVKLNIEMSMASLITKLARGSTSIGDDDRVGPHSSSHQYFNRTGGRHTPLEFMANEAHSTQGNITKETSIHVTAEDQESKQSNVARTTSTTAVTSKPERHFFSRSRDKKTQEEDQFPLKNLEGHDQRTV